MAGMNGWDVVVLGGANTDYTVRGPALPKPGETIEGDLFLEGAGGKGVNQAVAAARLGARVALISRVGADAEGDAVLAALEAERVDARSVARGAAARTGGALIHIDRRGGQRSPTPPR